jgi:hypothetical protein
VRPGFSVKVTARGDSEPATDTLAWIETRPSDASPPVRSSRSREERNSSTETPGLSSAK